MPNVQISINTRRPNGLLRSRAIGSEAGRWLLEALQSAVSGKNQSDGIMWSANDTESVGDFAHLGQALGAVFIDEATATGAVGAAIGHAATAVTVTYATSGVATATALAAAINANTTVNRRVTATNLEMRLTLATVLAGTFIDICNVRFTARAGAPTAIGEFNISGSDTADALSLAQAINQHSSLALRWRAWSALGVVHVVRTTALGLDVGNTAAGLKFEGITNPGSASTITVNAPLPVASAYCTILAAVPGDIGDEVSMTASGTGVTALTNGTTGFLGQGTGGGTVPYLVVP